MDESSASQLTWCVRHPHTAGIAANLAPDLLRQKEEDARISQEDADMEQLMALGMGPARVGTHEEEVCAAVGAMFFMHCCLLISWLELCEEEQSHWGKAQPYGQLLMLKCFWFHQWEADAAVGAVSSSGLLCRAIRLQQCGLPMWAVMHRKWSQCLGCRDAINLWSHSGSLVALRKGPTPTGICP